MEHLKFGARRDWSFFMDDAILMDGKDRTVQGLKSKASLRLRGTK